MNGIIIAGVIYLVSLIVQEFGSRYLSKWLGTDRNKVYSRVTFTRMMISRIFSPIDLLTMPIILACTVILGKNSSWREKAERLSQTNMVKIV